MILIWLLHFLDFCTDVWMAVVMLQEGRHTLRLRLSTCSHAYTACFEVSQTPDSSREPGPNARNPIRIHTVYIHILIICHIVVYESEKIICLFPFFCHVSPCSCHV